MDITGVKRGIVRDTVRYAGGQILARGLGLVRGLLVAAFLGPATYGLWSAMSLILTYGSQSHLGIFNALDREVPLNRGKNDPEKAVLVQDVALSSIFSLPLLIALVLFGISFLYSNSPEVAFGLRILAPTLIFSLIYNYFNRVFRTYNRFNVVARLVVITAIIDALLSISLSKYFGIYGLFIAQLTVYFAITFIAKRYHTFKIRIRFDYVEALRLLKIGFPILIVGLTATLLMTADRLMIINFLGRVPLGYYAIGLGVANVLLLVPQVISQVLYPQIAYAFGKTQRKEDLQPYVTQPQTLMSLANPIVAGLLYIIYPLLVTLLLPDYIPGIAAVRILIIGWVFMSFPGPGSALYTINRQKTVLAIVTVAVVINVTLNYVAIRLGMGIVGVALATGTTYGLNLLVANGIGLHYLNMPKKSIGLFLVRIISPLIYVIFLLFLISQGISLFNYSPVQSNIYFRTGLELVLFAGGIIPLAVVLWRKIKQLGIIEAVKTWRQS